MAKINEKIVIAGALLVSLVVPNIAIAQTGAYKLIIVWYQSNLTVIDYPNEARCQAAKQAVLIEVLRRTQADNATLPKGVVIGASPNGAFCIPG